MKIKMKIYIALVGIVMVLIILASTKYMLSYNEDVKANAQNQGSEIVTNIKFLYVNFEYDNDIANIINEFNLSHKGIRVEGIANSSVDKQVVSIMSGNGHDVGLTYWPNAIRWAQNGLLEPLTSYMAKSKFDIDDFLPIAVDMGKYEGTIYAIPHYIQTMALCYNIDMLKEAGFDHPPRTMDELKTMSKKLTVLDKDGTIKRMGFLPDHPWIDNVLWPILFGAEFYDRNRNVVTTTSPEYVQAIEFQNWFYKEWGWENVTRFKLKFETGSQDPFYTKKLAMVMGGDWIAERVRKYSPDLKFGICPFPYPDNRPDLKGANMISASMVYVTSSSKKKDQAWEFLEYLVSKKSMLSYVDRKECLMARKSTLQDPKITSDPNLKILSDFALNEKTRSFPPLPIVDEYLRSLTEQIEMVFEQRKTPFEAMNSVKQEIDSLLQK